MKTQLEQELRRSRERCWRALSVLNKSCLARWLLAPKDFEYLIAELNYLVKEVDAIYGLITAARFSFRDGEEIRGLLLESGYFYHHQSQQPVVQFTQPEQAIAESLNDIRLDKRDMITKISRKIEDYNSELRVLLLSRDMDMKTRWILNFVRFPSVEDMPSDLDIQLISDFYEENLEWYLDGYIITTVRPDVTRDSE